MLKYYVLIGDEEVVVDSIEVTEDKGEELDFGSLKIPLSSRSTNYQILDTVKIMVTDTEGGLQNYKEFVVISDKVTRASKHKDLYNHNISFVESIHRFEKVWGSSFNIIQPKDGDKLTLLDVLQKVKDLIPFERNSIHEDTRLFVIDTDLADYLSNIEAPQFFWRALSLREILNELASYVNGIAKMDDNHVLIFDFYNEVLSQILYGDALVDRQLEAQTRYYSMGVNSIIQNAVSSDDDTRSYVVVPDADGWITPRATTLKLEDTKFEFRLPSPIETMVKVEYLLDYEFDGTEYELSIDCTDKVLPKQLWDLQNLESQYYEARYNASFKANTLYYEIGGKTIKNDIMSGFFDNKKGSDEFQYRLLNDLYIDSTNGDLLVSETEPSSPYVHIWGYSEIKELNKLQLRFTYIPYFSTRVNVEKHDSTDVSFNTQLPVNQSDRIVSAEKVYRNLYGQVQRLGQDAIKIQKYGLLFDELFNVGDYTSDGFIIAKRTITFDLYGFLATYEMSKNFNRFSNRIALSQENRAYDLPFGSQTVETNHLYTEYVEINTSPDLNTSLVTPRGVNVFANTLKGSHARTFEMEVDDRDNEYNSGIASAIVFSPEMTDYDLTKYKENTEDNDYGIYRQLIKVGGGNTMSFSWKFDDIKNAGDSLKQDVYFNGLTQQTGVTVWVNNNISYTDNNGELENIEMSFHSKIDIPTEDESRLLPVVKIPTQPLIGGHGRFAYESADSLKVLKGSGDILSMNYQLQVVPKYNLTDVYIVGEHLVKNNNLLFDLPVDEDMVIYVSNEVYNPLETLKCKGTSNSFINYHVSVSSAAYDTANIEFLINADDYATYLSSAKSWALGNSNGDLYFAVNQDKSNHDRLYFNFLNKRTSVNYVFDEFTANYVQPPTNFVAGVYATELTLTWDEIYDRDYYQIEFWDSAQELWLVDTQLTTQKIYSGLVTGETYSFRIKVVLNNGKESFYNYLEATTRGVPGTMSGVIAYPTSDTSAIVSWEFQTNTYTYTLEYSLFGQGDWSTIPNIPYYQTNYELSNLQSGEDYDLRIRACNGSGCGTPSGLFPLELPSEFVTLAPEIRDVIVGTDFITFNVQNIDPEPAVIYYSDPVSTANWVSWGLLESGHTVVGDTGVPITISGITSGNKILFVKAQADGKEENTSMYQFEIATQFTASPTISLSSIGQTDIAGTITNNDSEGATLFWEIGDSTPDLYSEHVEAGASANISISGLTAGTAYTLYGYADGDTKDPSDPAVEYPFTTDSVPKTSTPNILNISTTQSSISFVLQNTDTSTVTMWADAQAGSYDPTPDINEGTVPGSSTSGTKTISGLQTGYTYYLSARADASGKDISSTKLGGSYTLTATTAPNAPSNFRYLSILGSEVTFQWTDNALNEDSFEIQFATNSTFTSGVINKTASKNAQSALWTFSAGSYYGRIRAKNSIGTSAWSTMTNDPFTVT